MKRLGSLLAVVILVGGLALVWQTQSVADNSQSTNAPTAAKSDSCCKSKAAKETAAKDSVSAVGMREAGSGKREAGKSPADAGGCDKAASAACSKSAKTGCPFSTASATQPAAVAVAEKSGGGCSAKATLAAYTADEGQPKTCPKTGEKKCCEQSGKKCCETADGQKKCCGDKENCPKAAGEGCAKSCDKACPKVTAAAATTRPSTVADKTGCCASKAQLAAAPAEPKSSECSKRRSPLHEPPDGGGCSKSKASVAAATQPAASPAGQTKSCSKSTTSLVSASDSPSAAPAQPVAQ